MRSGGCFRNVYGSGRALPVQHAQMDGLPVHVSALGEKCLRAGVSLLGGRVRV